MTVTPLQAGLWSEFDQLADETAHDERWQAIAGGLLGATPPGTPACRTPSAPSCGRTSTPGTPG